MEPKINICDDCIYSVLIDWDTRTYWCSKYENACATNMCDYYISCDFDDMEE